MKKLKIFLNIFLSFILMIGIISSTFLIIINNYSYKKNMLKKFEEINLYNSVYEEVRDGFENYIYQSGLDLNIIDKICTREKVKNDILSIVNSMYGDGETLIDTTEIRANLEKSIMEYVENEGRKLSKEEEENIKIFEDLIEGVYKNEIGLYQKGSDKIARKLPQVLSFIKNLEIIVIGLTAFLLIVLIILNSKILSVAGSYVGVSLFSSGILLFFFRKIIISKIEIDSLVIFTKSLSNSVIIILKDVLSIIQTFGTWYVVFGIFNIVIMNILLIQNDEK
ncbi:MAG: hypothetical protein IKM97_03000 [Clostridia bacterium]|nr:hypothetical protein [Clostridia bacterium]